MGEDSEQSTKHEGLLRRGGPSLLSKPTEVRPGMAARR